MTMKKTFFLLLSFCITTHTFLKASTVDDLIKQTHLVRLAQSQTYLALLDVIMQADEQLQIYHPELPLTRDMEASNVHLQKASQSLKLLEQKQKRVTPNDISSIVAQLITTHQFLHSACLQTVSTYHLEEKGMVMLSVTMYHINADRSLNTLRLALTNLA